MSAISKIMLLTTKKHQKNGFFNFQMAINRRSNRFRQFQENVRIFSKKFDILNISSSHSRSLLLLTDQSNMIGNKDSFSVRRTITKGNSAVNTNNMDAITRFERIHQIMIEQNIHRNGQLTGRSAFGHFLNGKHLVILVGGQTVFGGENVPVFIVGGV